MPECGIRRQAERVGRLGQSVDRTPARPVEFCRTFGCHSAQGDDGQRSVLGEKMEADRAERCAARMRACGKDRRKEYPVRSGIFGGLDLVGIVGGGEEQPVPDCGDVRSAIGAVGLGKTLVGSGNDHQMAMPSRYFGERPKAFMPRRVIQVVMAKHEPRLLGKARKRLFQHRVVARIAEEPQEGERLARRH